MPEAYRSFWTVVCLAARQGRVISARVLSREDVVPPEGYADAARVLAGAQGAVAVIGPGLGAFVVALARGAERVEALTPDPLERIQLESALADRGIEGVSLRAGPASGVDLGSHVFDLVVCGSGELSTAHLVDLLAPEGQALVSMASRWPLAIRPGVLGHARRRHGDRVTRSELAAGGLRTRWLFPLPIGVAPAIVVDEAHWQRGFAFYMRHLYPANTAARRLVGRLLVAVPALLARALAPDRWLVAGRALAPTPLPTTIVGTPLPQGEIKVVDWEAATVTGTLRSTGKRVRAEALVPGWSAESWTMWPLRAAARDRRRERLLDALGPTLAGAHVMTREPDIARSSVEQARAGLAVVEGSLPVPAASWCRDLVSRVAVGAPVVHAPEHGDLQLRNLVVGPGGTVEAIDRPYEVEQALVGSDATRVVVDLLCRSAGEPGFDLGLAIGALDRVNAGLRAAVGRFLVTALGRRDPAALADAMALAVLRDARNGAVDGVATFFDLAASGRLEAVLQRALAGA